MSQILIIWLEVTVHVALNGDQGLHEELRSVSILFNLSSVPMMSQTWMSFRELLKSMLYEEPSVYTDCLGLDLFTICRVWMSHMM